MLRTPKERFIACSLSGAWGKITQSEAFEEAIHAALGELNDRLPIETATPQFACDAYQQLVGARKYMEILCSLHTPQTAPKQTPRKVIDYSAGV